MADAISQSCGQQMDTFWEALKRSPELAFHALLYAWAAQQFTPGRVLDLGSEYGIGSALLAWSNPKLCVTGLDLEIDPLINARKTLPDKRFLFLQAEADQLPFANRAFTGICLVNLLHLVEDPRPVLKESYRVLADGGLALVVVPLENETEPGERTRTTHPIIDLATRLFKVSFPEEISGKLPQMPPQSFRLHEQAAAIVFVGRRQPAGR